MKLTSEIKNKILDRLSSSDQLPAGSCCTFVDLGKIGAKIYRTGEEASTAYEHQARAFELGLGPAVGELFRIVIRAGASHCLYIYGHLTETVKVVSRIDYNDPRLILLKSAMQEEGFATNDVRYNNVGLVEDMLVCLDFDLNSMVCY